MYNRPTKKRPLTEFSHPSLDNDSDTEPDIISLVSSDEEKEQSVKPVKKFRNIDRPVYIPTVSPDIVHLRNMFKRYLSPYLKTLISDEEYPVIDGKIEIYKQGPNQFILKPENLITIISKEEECLNDEIINGYIHILLKKYNKTTYVALDSLLYPIIMANFSTHKKSESNQKMRELLSSVNNTHDAIIIPVIEGNNHWTLIFIDIVNGEIHYYNSMYISHKKSLDQLTIASRMAEFLYTSKMMKQTPKLKRNESSFILVNHGKTVPQQDDGTNCGIYMLFFIDCILQGREIYKTMNVDPRKERQMIFDDLFSDVID